MVMENLSSPENETDPRTEALEEAAFTVWQFAASFQRLPFSEATEPIRPPRADDWKRASELSEEFAITPQELSEQATVFFDETLRALFPSDDLEFFQKIHQEAIRKNQLHRAKFAIKGAVERRVFRLP